MSNLADELRERGLLVADRSRPLANVEPGRLEEVRKKCLPGVTQEDVASEVGVVKETLKNWSDKPRSINESKATRLVAAYASLFAKRYGIDDGNARGIFLSELAADEGRKAAEEAYESGMYCILMNAPKYLFAEEMEALCDLTVSRVLDERRSQVAQEELARFVELADAWKRLRRAWGNGSAMRIQEAGEALRGAISTYREAMEKFEG